LQVLIVLTKKHYRSSKMKRTPWLAVDPSKRHFEWLMMWYQPVWITAVGLVVATGVFDLWGQWGYLAFGISVALPPWILPCMFPTPVDIYY
jgi:hypothetical protein